MEQTKIKIHPFNEMAIDAIIANVPNLTPNMPKLHTKQDKKYFVYDRIKNFNHDEIIKTYNLFFEATVSILN